MSDIEPSDPDTSSNETGKRGGAGTVIVRALMAGVILVVLGGAGFAVLLKWAVDIHNAPGPLTENVRVTIEPGTGLQQISDQLEDAGVIERPEIFIAMLRYSGMHTKLKAGEYEFEPQISQVDVADMLIGNDVVARFVTIPEGLTSTQIVALLNETEGLTGLLTEVPPEGSLLPETYHHALDEPRADVLARMRDAMDETLAELWEARQADLPYANAREALTMASIIEKETGVDAERERVAAVFVNRLRIPMRLQSDPTVVFALTEGKAPLGRSLTRQDWRFEHPYNTYRIDGLPPGPIANPGRAAIEAALNPADTKELFFVADGTGGHAFAKTLAEHNRNVANWRKIRDAATSD